MVATLLAKIHLHMIGASATTTATKMSHQLESEVLSNFSLSECDCCLTQKRKRRDHSVLPAVS